MSHSIDLKHEQQASLERPRYAYSPAARFFFASMDLLTGREVTLAKAKLLEMLACIPYRAWEAHQYARLTRRYRDPAAVQRARDIVTWGRAAQDNEYWHLLVLQEKMQADGLRDPWYLASPLLALMVSSYVIIARLLATSSLRGAFLFNAEFEDHAEHEYARFVAAHPEWETQPVHSPVVAQYTQAQTWADVFRRIGLDERDHRNRSFVYGSKPEHVVAYVGMPEHDA